MRPSTPAFLIVALAVVGAAVWWGIGAGGDGAAPHTGGAAPAGGGSSEAPAVPAVLPKVAELPVEGVPPQPVPPGGTPEGVPTHLPFRELVAVHRRDVTDLHGMLELPGDLFVPMLNGVTQTKSLLQAWPKSVPWSPIVGVVREASGIEWYAHADGSRSTTQFAWEETRQERVALTRVANPAAAPGRGSAPAGAPAGGPAGPGRPR